MFMPNPREESDEDHHSAEPSPSSFTSPLDTFAAMTAAMVMQQQQFQQQQQQYLASAQDEQQYMTNNEETNDAPSNISRNGSSARMNAIAKLKRAASQREMRNKSPGPNLDDQSFSTTPEPQFLHPMNDINGPYSQSSHSAIPYDFSDAGHTGIDTLPAANASSAGHFTPSPLPDGRNLSPFGFERAAGASSSLGVNGVQRSRSRNEGGGRSPLPSLEQLRARILQERAAAGLARSASTSAASAAARQYALDKLLGSSGREGAVSPVSDTAEDQEEEEKRMSVHKTERKMMLRRSRTIGGLSAAAEAQRKAAFVEALDKGIPDEKRDTRRSSRRFAHAPPGASESRSNFEPDEASYQQLPIPGPSQERQIIRTEMLRKLSTRRGARSPGNVLDENSNETDEQIRTRANLNASPSSKMLLNMTPSPAKPASATLYPTPPSSAPLKSWRGAGTPSPNMQTRLLTVPQSGSGSLARSPSSHSSTAGMHEDERNRASEMARFFGEEAFEYERLLELGYTTDDAYERVASARSYRTNSVMDASSTAMSPRSAQGEWGDSSTAHAMPTAPFFASSAKDEERKGFDTLEDTALEPIHPATKEDQTADRTEDAGFGGDNIANLPVNVSPIHASQPNTITISQDEWVSKHPSEASIPLGFDTSMVDDSNFKSNTVFADHDRFPTNASRPSLTAYPDSVANASRTSESSEKRESDSNSRSGRKNSRPSIAPISTPNTKQTRTERIEDLLTPGFLAEVGNPLDYSASPIDTPDQVKKDPFESVSRGGDAGGVSAEDSSSSDDSEPDEGAENSADYLQHVDRMTRKLEKFTKKSKRSQRDDAVQQSSAAQVRAAAEDSARELPAKTEQSPAAKPWKIEKGYDHVAYRGLGKDEATLTRSTSYKDRNVGVSPKAAPNAALGPKVAPHTGLGPLKMPDPNHVSPSHYMTNDKLAPFPGLLTQQQKSDHGDAKRIPSVKRKPSPLVNPPKGPLPRPPTAEKIEKPNEDLTNESSISVATIDANEMNNSAQKETFFSTLRRKASNAAARKGSPSPSPAANNGQTDKEGRPSSPTKKFTSFLTRKISQKAFNGATSHKRDGSIAQKGEAKAVNEPSGDSTPFGSYNSSPNEKGSPVNQSKLILQNEQSSKPALSNGKHGHTPSASAINPAISRIGGISANHSRNASVSSTMTNQQVDDPTLVLDPGHAISPPFITPPAALAPATAAVLHRYSRMLTAPNESSNLPDIPGLNAKNLDDPPRRYIMSAPMLQVVTSSTVKDRFVFLFSDLILLAKPMRPPTKETDASALPTLAWTFSVKSILPLNEVKLTLPKLERRQNATQTPLMAQFVAQFKTNPKEAFKSVISQTSLPNDITTMAKLLHQTPELDKAELSKYLFSSDQENAQVMRAFVYQEKFAGVSIESALRSLLLELRFPSKREELQEMLSVFARQWTETNRELIKSTFTSKLAVELVTAIMTLNDALHSHEVQTPGYYSEPNAKLDSEEFIKKFRAADPGLVLSDRTLLRIYSSVSADAIQQAMLPEGEEGERNVARILAPGIPMRIVYGVWSEPIKIAIPRADPGLSVRIYGQGLQFSPQILSFENGHIQEFKVTSKSLGVHSIIFVRAGKNARNYTSTPREVGEDFPLPRSINISVQRAFMQHCFTVTHSAERRFMMSVEDDAKRKAWLRGIKERLDHVQRQKKNVNNNMSASADSLAMHVLKETLIKPDVPVSILQRSASTASPLNGGMSNAKTHFTSAAAATTLGRAPSDSRALLHPLHGIGSAALGNRGLDGTKGGGLGLGNGFPSSLNNNVSRQESISKHYYGAKGPGHSERDLLDQTQLARSPLSAGTTSSSSPSTRSNGQDLDRSVSASTNTTATSVSPTRTPIESLTGEELILTVKQNSLLSLVIAHAQSNSTAKNI
ncbi:uncharacterized protein FA14DRAFT_162285 [Meira miltonrushii]|uniref:SEC7 domain-containing protein n=1 Tax=Meira miltonrushii TaxID=1280837 RepID=A0A316V333_9BASI|nr:uncharacterized protein FA14DRAFT_162285 [Meira miltonrushii]PWN31966.1 hypothetical protein FA14DRAFT_162285 [Meira miltonrushii]